MGSDKVYSHMGRGQCLVPLSNTSEGRIKSSRRLPQQEETEGGRLGSESRSLQSDHSKMGSSGGGFIRLKRKCQDSALFIPKQVGWSSGGGRSGPNLAVLQVLCFPPSGSNTSSPEETAGGEHNTDSHRTSLAQETMVLYPEGFINRTSLDSANPGGSPFTGSNLLPAGREVESGSLASEEELLRGKGFSERLVETLLSCRKKETQAIYQKV